MLLVLTANARHTKLRTFWTGRRTDDAGSTLKDHNSKPNPISLITSFLTHLPQHRLLCVLFHIHKMYLKVCLRAKQMAFKRWWSWRIKRGSKSSWGGKGNSTPVPSYCSVPSGTAMSTKLKAPELVLETDKSQHQITNLLQTPGIVVWVCYLLMLEGSGFDWSIPLPCAHPLHAPTHHPSRATAHNTHKPPSMR